MPYFVYILKSLKSGRFYIGQTSDLNKRLLRRNSGGSVFTKNIKPFKLIKYETYNSRSEAVIREKKIKSYKGGEEFKKLIEDV